MKLQPVLNVIVCDDAVYLIMKMKSAQETRRQLNGEERRQKLEQEENNDSWGILWRSAPGGSHSGCRYGSII